ncbi:MAG: tetratricopeptide repeat protein [Candidatus Acidiferrales bacterium]
MAALVLTPLAASAQIIFVIHVRDQDTLEPIKGAVVELLEESGPSLDMQTVGSDGKATLTPSYLPRSRRVVAVVRAAGFEEARTEIQYYRRQRQATAWLLLKPVLTFYSEVAEEIRAVTPKARQEFARALQVIGEKGEAAKAIEHLRKAIKEHSDFPEAHYLLGSLLLDLGRVDEAEQEFRKVIQLNSRFAPAYIALGTLRNRQGLFREAQEFLEQGVALDPEDWTGRVELVRALHQQGNLKEAERYGLEAHDLDPAAPEVHLLLADVYVVEGDPAKVRREYEHFLALVPRGAHADRVRQLLTNLDGTQPK